jgi:hypothetical protein
VERLDDRTVPSTFTLTVKNLLDSGTDSLRQAIENANTHAYPDNNLINFASGLSGAINLTSALPSLSTNIDIEGPGANLLTVRRDTGSYGIFTVDSGATVSISGLTVSNGQNSGIRNAGTLTLSTAIVSDNSADEGGGLYNSGTATVTACTFTGNYGGWSGSALYNVSAGTLSLVNSTISGNVSNPEAQDLFDGGMGCIGSEGSTIITNSTIAGNTGYFGGIWTSWASYTGTLKIRNTIVAGNASSDITGDIVSQGHNLIGTTWFSNGVRTDLGDRLNVNPLLGPLQDNGGPTPTMALLPGSPALDAGDNTNPPATDQRGLSRIVDGNGDGTATIDIGAYELQQASTVSTTINLTSSLNPSVYTQAVTFTATVTSSGTGTPTGTVTFKDGTTILDTATLSGGQAQFTTSSLVPGTHSIAAVYSGDTNFRASATALSQVVNRVSTTTTLSSSANPSTVGQAVTLTAKVTPSNPGIGTLTGRVGFREGSTTLGVAYVDPSGLATLTFPGTDAYGTPLAALSAGSHTITAYYWNDPIFGESTSTALTQMVNQVSASTTTTLSSSPTSSVSGQSVTFTAVVTSSGTGIPTGTVTFKDGSTTLGTGTLDSTGKATFATAALSIGTHSITAIYSSNTNNFSDSTTTALTQTVNKANTTTGLTSSANPSVYRQAVTFKATVAVVSPGAGTPAGTVTFYEGSIALGTGTLNANGIASFTTSSLGTGRHTITAVYQGSTNYKTSTSAALTQTVNRASTTTTLVSSSPNPSVHGQPLTFTVTVVAVEPGGGTPAGTATFYDGSTALSSVSLSGGEATFTTSSLGVGTHTITVAYKGNTNYRPSTSLKLIQTVSA